MPLSLRLKSLLRSPRPSKLPLSPQNPQPLLRPTTLHHKGKKEEEDSKDKVMATMVTREPNTVTDRNRRSNLLVLMPQRGFLKLPTDDLPHSPPPSSPSIHFPTLTAPFLLSPLFSFVSVLCFCFPHLLITLSSPLSPPPFCFLYLPSLSSTAPIKPTCWSLDAPRSPSFPAPRRREREKATVTTRPTCCEKEYKHKHKQQIKDTKE